MRSGSIEDIVARLTLWGRRAPKGLARVEFDSEFARKRVVNGLRLALAEAGVLFHEIELPVRTPTSRVVRDLVDQLDALASGVVSLSGFATAFPEEVPLEDSLRVFNFHRENFARPPVCQIWWMPTSFAEQFIRTVPDLDSWFMVRLRLTEVVLPPSEMQPVIVQLDRVTANLEDARKRAANLVARFDRALAAGTPIDEIRRNLLLPAVNALREGGADREAQEWERTLNRKLAEARKGSSPPRVFISYSHDSREHMDRVLDLANRLRAEGIDCILDQYEVLPPEGWPCWMDKQIRDADFVLMICTETYYRRVMGEETSGTGLGVRWEGNLIYQHIYNLGTLNTRFIPVLLESGDFSHIPTPLQGATHYRVHTDDGYEDLYRHLTNQHRALKPELGQLRPMPPLERKQDFFRPWNVSYPRNPFFTGREEVLGQLHAAFTSSAATAQTYVQVISGLGGVGKTQTVVEYAYRYRNEYNAVFLASAATELAPVAGYVEIAKLLDLPEKDAQNQDDTVRAVKGWLENNSGWLLILDNADNPGSIKPFLPHNPKGHILVTSRAAVFDALGVTNPIELGEMSPGEAVQFLCKRTGRDGNDPAEKFAAEQIASELGGLPLALEQTGAYITKMKSSFQDYLVSYRKRGPELLEKTRAVTGEYPKSIATTWSLNFEQVEQTSKAAADLLRFSALLSPDKIPLELITLGAVELGPALSAALANVDSDPVAFDEVLEPLTQYSLIRRDLESRTYDIHRLVQAVLKDRMDEATLRQWAERTVRAVERVFPGFEFSEWYLCERLLSHALVCVELIERRSLKFPEAARLLNNVGGYLYKRARFVEAEPLFLRSLRIALEVLGPDHPDVATSLHNLAALYHAQGKYAQAEPLYKQALAIREKTLGSEHPDVALSLSNLAGLYDAQGKYAEAEPLFQRALAIHEKALGAEHSDVATDLNNLALLYKSQGKYAEAESLYKRSLAIREKILGLEHPDVAIGLNNLAALYYAQGKYAEAEPLYRQSLAIQEKTLGLEHPDVAQDFNNLAVLCRAQGRYDEAEPLYKQSLAIWEKALGPEHPHVATSLENYAFLLRQIGREAEAAKMEVRAEAIRTKHAQKNPTK